jgi:hypothetical protein
LPSKLEDLSLISAQKEGREGEREKRKKEKGREEN